MNETSEAVQVLGEALACLPQENIPTEHYFANGMYARVMGQASGSIVIGKQHKHEHFLLILTGAIRFTEGDGEAQTYYGPSIIVSKPGAQRALLALEDSTYMTIHRTDKTDLDEIENEISKLLSGKPPCRRILFHSERKYSLNFEDESDGRILY